MNGNFFSPVSQRAAEQLTELAETPEEGAQMVAELRQIDTAAFITQHVAFCQTGLQVAHYDYQTTSFNGAVVLQEIYVMRLELWRRSLLTANQLASGRELTAEFDSFLRQYFEKIDGLKTHDLLSVNFREGLIAEAQTLICLFEAYHPGLKS